MTRTFAASLFATGFAAAAAFWSGIIDPATAPRWAALAVLVPFCLFVAPPASVPRGAKVFAVGCILLAALSICWTPDVLGGVDELAHFAILAAAFWLGAVALDLTFLWVGVAVGFLLSAALVVPQVFGFSLVDQAVPPSGLFSNRNVLAEAALVAVAALPSMPLMIASAVVLALAGSRGALVGVAVVLAVRLAPKRRRAALACLVLAVAGGALTYLVAPASVVERFGYWQEVLGALAPFGHGLGSFAAADPFAEFAHSEPLQAIYEVGILALPLFALAAYALGGGDVWTGKLVRERGVLAGVVAVGFFSFPFHMPLTAFAAAVAAGHLVAGRLRLRDRDDVGRIQAYAGA